LRTRPAGPRPRPVPQCAFMPRARATINLKPTLGKAMCLRLSGPGEYLAFNLKITTCGLRVGRGRPGPESGAAQSGDGTEVPSQVWAA
jgi:hypothetical protein